MTALIRAPRSLLLRSTVSALAAATILLTAVGLPAPASAAPSVGSIADPQEHDDGPGDAFGTGDVPGAPGAVAPSAGTSRVIGKLVLQNRSSGSSAYVGLSSPESGRNVQRLYSSSVGGAASLAGTYSLPAVGAAGPITGTGTSSSLCLAPTGDAHRALVAARTCTGSPSQAFEWRYVSNKWVSGYALYPVSSAYSLGGADSDAFVELTMNALADVVVESQLAPIAPFELRTPAIGATVDTPTPTFSGVGQSGTSVSIRTDAQVELASTSVPADSTSWSVPSIQLAPGRYTGTATQSGTGSDVQVRFDFTVPAPLAPGASIPTPTLTPGQSVEVEATFNADAGGQRIDVYHPANTRITAVDNPAFTLDGLGIGGTLPVGTTTLRFTLRANDDAPIGEATGGKVTYGSSRVTIADFTANIVRAPDEPIAPLVVESPRRGETITETTPVFRGTGEPGSRVEIRGAWGDVLGAVERVDASGDWSITWNKSLLPSRYAGGTVKQFVNGVPTHAFVYDFTIVQPRLVVTSPKIGDTITGTRPVFTGTANPGARVQITGAWGTDLGSTTADARTGDWTITWRHDYQPARYFGGTVTEAVGGKVIGSTGYDFTLAH
ncbi:hypothetical protein SAMN06295974_3931 [Plantibacter flavus]|uniref:Bacterial Ig domain-containing protein n=1 Tax=Plantibacter flavus TaxID=150123 RepID=A0A3N2BY91_9MICO|nr:hypothetical protein [Plantibacter flavus]ROR80218.1 hypothetical protein EDD42_0255 [Plantibacter flavus]SMG50404.1 hypothetical protein SAMN06295974_3931 [Plantibacter flavus]